MFKFFGPLAAVAMLAGSAAAFADVTIDFDGVPQNDAVNGFYNGGTSSSGASGPDVGVQFNDFIATGGFGQTSQPNLGYVGGVFGYSTTDFGFTELSFTAGFFVSGTVTVWSGVDGTGTVLATLSGVLGDPSAFQPYTIDFAGVARSFTAAADDGVSGGVLGFDDIVFGTAVVPEPASWALMIAGFGLVGSAMRRRATTAAA